MPTYEYKVVPAPTKGEKAKGVKTPEARFARALETLMNQLGQAGWEYQRADLLPSEERSGLTGSTTTWRNVLVFRRPLEPAEEAFQPRLLAAEPAEAVAEAPVPEPARLATGAERMLKDNGVEELSDVAGVTDALRTRAAMTASDETDEAPRPDDGPSGAPDDPVTLNEPRPKDS